MNSLRIKRAASSWHLFRRWIPLCVALLTASHVAQAQYSQQARLLGSGTLDGSYAQGPFATALSGDGNTAIVGAPSDNNGVGAVYVFTRSGTTWTQQGPKLVGTPSGGANQGQAVALSADGNTAIVGGPGDGNDYGAAWVFTRSGSTWSQPAKLVGTGAVGPCPYTADISVCPAQGTAVALSSDGNTAIVGGPGDAFSRGAAWIFTRSGTTWTQQGSKLVANDAAAGPALGSSVALSGDGNTAVAGGPLDGAQVAQVGAAWVFTRSGNTWTQQGPKLVGNDYTLYGTGIGPRIGSSVALSADGNTVAAGGPYDGGRGAAWVFTRTGGTWTQQGPKIVDSRPGVPDGYQGTSVALSGDGSTVMLGVGSAEIGAPASPFFVRSNGLWCELGTTGVASLGTSVALSHDGSTALSMGWVFVRSAVRFPATPATHDFNCDGKSDILWNNPNGDSAIWLMDWTQVAQSAGVGNASSWSIWGQRDFNGDGTSDILWQDVSGDTAIWFMSGTQVLSSAWLGNVPSSTWTIVGTGDFNNDGKGDILWRNTSGIIAIWFLNGGQVSASASVGSVPANWLIYGTGDFDGDGKTDILWRDNNGNTAIWFMNGSQVSSSASVGTVSCCWTIVGTGDFNGDGKSDILWRNSVGDLAVWLMNGAQVIGSAVFGNVPTNWTIAETGDFDGNGQSDILWRDSGTGTVAIWLIRPGLVVASGSVATVGTSWTIEGLNAD
jgi:hypothetical protein